MKECTCAIPVPAAPLSNSPLIYCLLCGLKVSGAALATKEESNLEKAGRLFQDYQEGINYALTFDDSALSKIIQELYHMGYVIRPVPGMKTSDKNCKWRLVYKDSLLPVFQPELQKE